MAGGEGERATLAAVGDWSMEVVLLSIPDLKPASQQQLGGEVIPRSVLLSTFDGAPYLLCGLGDGTLCTWHIQLPNAALTGEYR